ncbi:hypothetical protein PHYBOEH_000389 [Phytophthora boehmeriae]|uniref:RxLR effector protein n=1 Tax=Phytophthora boehmeriae TaxID=109152 RepID=A0A8T1X1M0_9STRA|nr:hypothetical protein PHYBOEH_000389 [Phytophthora boehmeriae]
MRVSSILLATAATLVATVDLTSAIATFVPTKLSSAIPVKSGNTLQNAGGGNRYLRSRNNVDKVDDDGEEEIDSDNEEERTVTDKMLNQFKKWHARGDTADDVYDKYMLASLMRKAYHTGNWAAYKEHPKYIKHINYVEYLKDPKKFD